MRCELKKMKTVFWLQPFDFVRKLILLMLTCPSRPSKTSSWRFRSNGQIQKKIPVDIIYRVLNTLSCKIYCIRSSLLSLTLGPSESVRSGRWFLAKWLRLAFCSGAWFQQHSGEALCRWAKSLVWPNQLQHLAFERLGHTTESVFIAWVMLTAVSCPWRPPLGGPSHGAFAKTNRTKIKNLEKYLFIISISCTIVDG